MSHQAEPRERQPAPCEGCGVYAELQHTPDPAPMRLCSACAWRHAVCCITCDRRATSPLAGGLLRGGLQCDRCAAPPPK